MPFFDLTAPALGHRMAAPQDMPKPAMPVLAVAAALLLAAVSAFAADGKESPSDRTPIPAKKSAAVPAVPRGLRAAFHVKWDPASLESLRQNVAHLDVVFPEWLHLTASDGRLRSADDKRRLFFALEGGQASNVDPALEELLSGREKPPQVVPLINNFDPERQQWADVSEFLASPWAQTVFRAELMLWLSSGEYGGIVLDLEMIPAKAQTAFRNLVVELASDLHSRGWKLYVAVPAGDPDLELAPLARHADALIVMNYDQHFDRTKAGPVASHGWFTANLLRIMKTVPAEKLICGIGNYGYEWPKGQSASRSLSVPDAWSNARRTGARIKFDGKDMNPRYTYTNAARVKHDVWFLDAVTALNQMRVAAKLGVNSFALWRLGAEDGALWQVWDQPSARDAAARLRPVAIPAAKTLPGARDVKEDRRTELMNKVTYKSLPQ